MGGGYPPPLTDNNCAQKNVAERGGPPPLNGQNPLSSFFFESLPYLVTHLQPSISRDTILTIDDFELANEEIEETDEKSLEATTHKVLNLKNLSR